ncbi:SusC/RagA family TonB-linked outer membrane protein [Lutibacter sp.]
MKLKKFFIKMLMPVLTFLLFVNSTYSQKVISGVVTDVNKDAIPGVSVIVKGTSVGTMTDLDGKYSLNVKEDAKILVFSYIGKETQELEIDGNIINCKLIDDESELEEIIVVGYGTMKKSDKTGAVSNITSDELNTGVLTDPIQGLQGKVAGVMITKQGGDPNAGFSVKIRGAAGFGSGTQPLYVIDGIPGVDPTTIAPEDIESYNVLKDASTTAIYGARGSNGVIIITTKKGSKQKGSKISFNSYVSIDNVAKRLDLLSADEVRSYVDKYNIDFTDGGANTDWQNEIYRTGLSQSHNLSVSGGNNNTSYYTSLTHSNFKGVIKGSSKQRTVGRINLSQKGLNDRLTISSSLSGTVEKNDYISYGGWGTNDVLYQAFRRSPTDPVYNADGTFLESDRMFNSKNPIATIEQIQSERSAKRFLGNLKADLEIYKGLILGTNLAYIRNDDESFNFTPTYSYKAGEGGAGRSYNNYDNVLLETTLKYNKTLNDTHNLNFVGGYSFQQEGWDGFGAGGSNPASNYIGYNNLALLQNVNPGDIYSYKSEARLISFFGRAIYNYNSKYFLTASVRRDGSSKFGDNKEWGIFPAVSAAWNIKDESFLKNVTLLSTLKLRASYGVSGNQDIGLYLDRTIFRPNGTAPNPETGETVIVFKGDKNPNPELQWEENREINIGLDFGLFSNRISGSVELYKKTTDHLLYEYPVPVPPNAYANTWANYGAIDNTGIEFDVHTSILNKKSINWKSSVTFSTNKQKVISIDGGQFSTTDIYEGYVSGPGMVGGSNHSQIVRTGYELGTFIMPEYASVSSDGVFLFYTEAGGVTRSIADAELRVVGNALPDFEMGWSNQIIFLKNFELNFAFRAVVGTDMLNATKMFFGNPNGLMPNGNVLHSALYEKERGLTSSPTLSSYYIEDASFIRLDNLTLAYNLNVKKIKGVEKIRFYFTSNNLLLFTKYTGIDPETTYDGLSFGIDNFNVYPKTKTYTFGLNLIF